MGKKEGIPRKREAKGQAKKEWETREVGEWGEGVECKPEEREGK